MSTLKQYRPVTYGAAATAPQPRSSKGPRTKNHKKVSQNLVSTADFYPSSSSQAQCGQPLQFKQKPSKAKLNGQKPSPTSFPIQRRTQGLPDMTGTPPKKYQMVASMKEAIDDEFETWRNQTAPSNNKLIQFDDVDDSDDSVDPFASQEPKTQSLVVLSSSGTTKLLSPQDSYLKRSKHPKFEVLQQSLGAQKCLVLDTSNDQVAPSEYLADDDDKTRRDSYDDSESGESQATTVGALTAAPVREKYKLEFDNVEIISSDDPLKNLTEVNQQSSQKMVETTDQTNQKLENANNHPTAKSVFNVNAPFFSPTEFVSSPTKEEQGVTPAAGLGGLKALAENLESTKNNFTPSTPYVHKFRTEMCKNYEMYGKCKYGDECSYAHRKDQLMVKTDVSILYKTKLCKKFSTVGHCPYGVRCQFIHDPTELQKSLQQPAAPQYVPVVKKEEPQVKLELSTKSTPFVAKQDSKEYKEASKQIVQMPAKRPARPLQPSQATALQLEKIVYSDILVHSFHVSVQEYQKKMKMFQKKIGKKRYSIHPPEMQYMNIYSQQLGRLPCFEAVTNQFEKEQRSKQIKASFGGRPCSDDEFEDEYEGGYFFGDAQAYEHHLERQMKQLNYSMFMPAKKSEFFSEPFTPQKPVSMYSAGLSGSTASSLENSGSQQISFFGAPSMFAPSQFSI